MLPSLVVREDRMNVFQAVRSRKHIHYNRLVKLYVFFSLKWNLLVTCIHSEQKYQISRTIVLHHAYHSHQSHSLDEIILDFQHQCI